jgi:hypothetical protein
MELLGWAMIILGGAVGLFFIAIVLSDDEDE